MHDSAYIFFDSAYIGGCSANNIKCVVRETDFSGERTEQLYIFCHVTGLTSDFLSFIDVELIWFFDGALHLLMINCQVAMTNSSVILSVL